MAARMPPMAAPMMVDVEVDLERRLGDLQVGDLAEVMLCETTEVRPLASVKATARGWREGWLGQCAGVRGI